MFEDEYVFLLDARRRRSSRGQLQGGVCPSGASSPPGTELVPDTHDLVISVEEGDVDCS
jgi:hypothetical protein